VSLERFNALPGDEAEAELRTCCASPAWAAAVARGRPYPEIPSLVDTAGTALAGLPWSEIAAALAAHPRIGERAAGAGRDAAWSRREQSGVAVADTATLDALAAVNREYEERFDRVFLIFATGRGPAEMLAEARRRLGNDEETERAEVRGELTKIAGLRLRRLVA
jgi:2-oxo-4-hydroxy-4-carboxy-5-ureidoimidazoline decarboxylase